MNERRTDPHVDPLAPLAADGASPVAGEAVREGAIRRLALFLEQSPEAVASNVAHAMQLVLCRLPWESRLRRSRDDMLLHDIRFLLGEMESDDIRRPRLKYLLEHAERRARM